MTTEQLKQFFEERPRLSLFGFCEDVGTSNTHINNIIKGRYRLTEKTAAKILPLMIHYGYKEPEV